MPYSKLLSGSERVSSGDQRMRRVKDQDEEGKDPGTAAPEDQGTTGPRPGLESLLVPKTHQNICQLLIHAWRQANPATRNRTRDHLISANSTARCSTKWIFAGLTPAIEPLLKTLNKSPGAQPYWHTHKKHVPLLCVSSAAGVLK